MNSTNFEKVCHFQREILHRHSPTKAVMSNAKLRELHCLQEELLELSAAMLKDDLVGAADAIADLIYFAYGLAYQMGLPMDEIFGAVHEANMAKQKGKTKRGHEDDAAKPADWVDPKITIARMLGQ